MSEIERIGNVFYVVEDMDSAVAFYGGKLGLELKFRDGDRWAAFDVGGTTLALATPGEAGGSSAGTGAVVSFRVADVAEWVGRAWTREGTPIVIEAGMHEDRVQITDPDGNRLVVYSVRAT